MTEQAKFYANKYGIPLNMQMKYEHEIDKPPRSSRRELFYKEDLQRMSVHSERAKLISQLIQPDDTREFTCNFYDQGNEYPAVITSHGAPASLLKRKPVITTHPNLTSNNRWDSNIDAAETESHADLDTTEFDCQQDVDSTHTDRCDNCRELQCSSKVHWTSNFKRFDYNIAVFCDQCTNTPRLNDASCGNNIPVKNAGMYTSDTDTSREIKNSPKCSDYSKYPEINEERCQRPQFFQKCPRASNLERINLGDDNCCHHDKQLYDLQEAVRDTDIPEESIKFRPRSSFRKVSDEKSFESDIAKKTLYNEGISDNIAHRYPVTLIRVPSPINMPRDSKSRTIVVSKPDNWIPYSYKIGSKYHHGCKECYQRPYYTDPVPDEVKFASRNLSKKYNYLYEKPYKESPKLPKRVLSSEKNIESFIAKYNPKVKIPLKCPNMISIQRRVELDRVG